MLEKRGVPSANLKVQGGPLGRANDRPGRTNPSAGLSSRGGTECGSPTNLSRSSSINHEERCNVASRIASSIVHHTLTSEARKAAVKRDKLTSTDGGCGIAEVDRLVSASRQRYRSGDTNN